MTKQNEAYLVYIGTYTRKESEGIYIYRFDTATGAFEYVSKATGVDNPSFLEFHPTKPYLYAANEVGEFRGKPGGALSAFAIDPETGELTFLNQQPTHGAAPCHLSVDQTGRYVLVANYSGGNLAVLPIQEDGSLGEATDIVQHEGASINPNRQDVPHAHSITIDANNQYAFAADLGIDKIMIYRLDLDQGKLIPNEHQPAVQVGAGAGPRHFDFHPNGQYAYLINELDSTIIAFSYEAAEGRLRALHTMSTLPADFSESSHCADVHVHPSGKFIYGSNRGHDSLAIYAIDPQTGRLTVTGYASTGGQTPRNFVIDPSGAFLLAANQNTDNILSFRVDPDSGALTPTGHEINVSMPVCLKLRSI